jgi:hypothetical protein
MAFACSLTLLYLTLKCSSPIPRARARATCTAHIYSTLQHGTSIIDKKYEQPSLFPFKHRQKIMSIGAFFLCQNPKAIKGAAGLVLVQLAWRTYIHTSHRVESCHRTVAVGRSTCHVSRTRYLLHERTALPEGDE